MVAKEKSLRLRYRAYPSSTETRTYQTDYPMEMLGFIQTALGGPLVLLSLDWDGDRDL